jgi:uncharacterized membrane protein
MADDILLNMRRHKQFAVAICVGIAAGMIALVLRPSLALPFGADVFFAAYIFLVLREMPRLTGHYLSKNARGVDLPLVAIFLITFGVVAVAIWSLFGLINQKDIAPPLDLIFGLPLSLFRFVGQNSGSHPVELTFALLSIPLGWFTIHTMAALHYAHVYWMDGDTIDAQTKKKAPVGGLLFPGENPPEGWDFLYFATVIGMTAQTADTNITTSHMRCVVLVHSILSFIFNTVIVAAAVNFAISLGSP